MALEIPCIVFGNDGSSFYPMSIGWSEGAPITIVTERPDAGRYVAILQVGDYVLLNGAYNGGNLFARMPQWVLDDAAAGRCVVLLDLSNEGPAFDKVIFDSLHQQMAVSGLTRSACLLVTQNRLLERGYQRVYGSGGLRFGLHDFFVKVIVATLDESMMGRVFAEDSALRAYRPGYVDTPRDYLSFNATPRWHRILLYRYLATTHYVDDGLLSFHGANVSNPKASAIDLSTIPEAIPRHFGDLLDGIEGWMPQTPIRFDSDARRGNDLAQSLEVDAYHQSLYSIVTESDFFEKGIERVTEKTIKAAGLGHPFLVVGAPRSISLMAELGFETFGAVFDHGYDRETDPALRMGMVFAEIARQRARIAADRASWIAETRETAAYNFAHARNGLARRFARLVEEPLLARLRRFVATAELI